MSTPRTVVDGKRQLRPPRASPQASLWVEFGVTATLQYLVEAHLFWHLGVLHGCPVSKCSLGLGHPQWLAPSHAEVGDISGRPSAHVHARMHAPRSFHSSGFFLPHWGPSRQARPTSSQVCFPEPTLVLHLFPRGGQRGRRTSGTR